MTKFEVSQEVLILTGKYNSYYGYVCCYVEPHKLSSKPRVQVRVQTGDGWRTLLINEENLMVGDYL